MSPDATPDESDPIDQTDHEAGEDGSGGRRRWLWIGGGVLAVVVVVAGLGIWWFLKDDAPAEVDLADAVSSLDESDESDESDGSDDVGDPAETGDTDEADGADPVTTSPDETSEDGATAADVDGEWVVDTTIGTFDFEDSTGTFVGFRVEEELTGIGSTTAVGRTPVVSGSITIDGSTVSAVAIEADMSELVTNDSRRDSRARGALDTDQFPTATFTLTEPIDLGADPASGDSVTATAMGELTVHGVTNPVEVPLEAQLTDGTIVIVGSVDVVFADYDVEVPSAPVVVSAEDNGIIELQLFLVPA